MDTAAVKRILDPCCGSRMFSFNPENQCVLFGGFSECFRVLDHEDILIFKWNETQIKLGEILALTNQEPLFGHKSGKRAGTHWICFMKRAASATGPMAL